MPTGQDYTEKDLHKIGKEFVEHCKKEDVWHVSSYATSKMKTYKWWEYMMNKHPIIKEYHEIGCYILGQRHYQAAMTDKPMPWVIKTFMPRLLKERESIRKQEEEDEYSKAKAQTKGKLDAIGSDKGAAGEILSYIESQKLPKREEDPKDSKD